MTRETLQMKNNTEEENRGKNSVCHLGFSTAICTVFTSRINASAILENTLFHRHFDTQSYHL